jgi:hypothetical protein
MARGLGLRFVVCVLASIVVAGVGVACGSNPPTSFADTFPSEAGTVPPHDSGSSESGGGGAGFSITVCVSNGDGGVRPLSECSCKYVSGAGSAFTLQCGTGLCSLITYERADCFLDGRLTITRDAGPDVCSQGAVTSAAPDGGVLREAGAVADGGLGPMSPCPTR